MPTTTDLTAIALRLQAILEPYREHLVEDEIYHMPVLRRKGAKKHDWFAGVQPVEGAVKLNLLPMHGHPELLDGVSRELLRHRTGASVLRFRRMDENLAGDLEQLVARAFVEYMGDR